jgi:hypothetical protein
MLNQHFMSAKLIVSRESLKVSTPLELVHRHRLFSRRPDFLPVGRLALWEDVGEVRGDPAFVQQHLHASRLLMFLLGNLSQVNLK